MTFRRPRRPRYNKCGTPRVREGRATPTLTTQTGEEQAMAMTLTEKAATEVKRIIDEGHQRGDLPEKVYLRMRVVGGGCSGFQHKLDLDKDVNPKLDDIFEMQGVPVVIDKRSQMYLSD